MLTRYMDQIEDWNSDMLLDDDFSPWAKALLLEWAADDTVSQKEIDRNNEIYAIQDNRNPFIDHPEYAQLIWDLSASISDVEQVRPIVYYQHSTLTIDQMEGVYSSVSIYSVSGKLVYDQGIENEVERVDIDLNSGLYILDFTGKKQRTSVKLLVITQ